MKFRIPLVVAATSVLLSSSVLAQSPPVTPAPASTPSQGSTTPIAGGIIGNVKSHVYHLPGDKGKMPAEKNRVYFHSEAEAQAAGYHRSGLRRTKGTTTVKPHKVRIRKAKSMMPPAPVPPPIIDPPPAH